jgi:hypothetical protein
MVKWYSTPGKTEFVGTALAWAVLSSCQPSPPVIPAAQAQTPSAPQARIPLKISPASAEKPVAGPKKAFGIYQWYKNASYQDGITQEIEALGTPPTYALYFVDMRRGFPHDVVGFNAARNIQTIVTQELSVYGEGWNEKILRDIAKGKWDGYFRRFARSAKAYRGVVYYRFGYEMNGDWVAWGENPRQFKAAWRRAWEIFRQENARNVRWVWSPNVLWGGRVFERDILPYYPGHKYVDVVGLDGYNFGERHSRHHAWLGFDEVFGASIEGMKRHFPRKPLWITEVGCADGERKAAWIQDFLRAFNADPALRMFVWFNEDKQYAGEPNWRLDSDMDSMHRFRDWAIFSNSITLFSLPDQAPPAAPLAWASASRVGEWM